MSHQRGILPRRGSVLTEIEETHDKHALETRSNRLMDELSSLCAERLEVMTRDSLVHIATDGKVEPLTLRKLPEPTKEKKDSKASGSAEDKRDAIRRKRVEELTRFFLDRKSEIGRSRDRPRSEIEAKKDTEDDKDDGDEASREQSEESSAETPVKGMSAKDKLHDDLLNEQIDTRVFNPLLLSIRDTEPLLYRAILGHPIVAGMDSKRDKDKTKDKDKKKKKRKERDREKRDKTLVALQPNFIDPQLSPEEYRINIARFVARAIADGTVQSLLIAVKLILSTAALTPKHTDGMQLLPLVSHMAVLRGQDKGKNSEIAEHERSAGPSSGYKTSTDSIMSLLTMRRASSVGENTATRQSEGDTGTDVSMDQDSRSSLGGSVADLTAPPATTSTASGAAPGDMMESATSSRAMDVQSLSAAITGEGGGENELDEEALMAQAIALSLSSVNDEIEQQEKLSQQAPPQTPQQQPRPEGKIDPAEPPEPFSGAEMSELAVFKFTLNDFELPAYSVVVGLLSHLDVQCANYIGAWLSGDVEATKTPSSVHPHPLTFLLLHSLLLQLDSRKVHSLLLSLTTSNTTNQVELVGPDVTAMEVEEVGGSALPNRSLHTRWALALVCGNLSLLRLLEANLFHVDVANLPPASVGLGQVYGERGEVDAVNPLPQKLKAHIVHHLEGEGERSMIKRVSSPVIDFPQEMPEGAIDDLTTEYTQQLRSQALTVWARGIPHFYPHHRDRQQLLSRLLASCVSNGSRATRHALQQLDLLCARMCLPDMAEHFVPTSASSSSDSKKDETEKSREEGSKETEQDLLRPRNPRTAPLRWTPQQLTQAVADGLTSQTLIEYLNEVAPPDWLQSRGLELKDIPQWRSSTAPHMDTLVNAYNSLWSEQHGIDQDHCDAYAILPKLVALLLESISRHPANYALPHVNCLVMNADEKTNPRVLLLRSLQELMVQQLAGKTADDSTPLEFDESRCAETIHISEGNHVAKQHTAKQWGTVMVSTGCAPGSGIHEWAVRLDKCEKGHIFLGVCTHEASMSTYVGGDRQGWGLIGTRALWHNRSKVRGDYGEGFSTGSVVKVQLNTDTGALSFGMEDSDWGVAFDGLTQVGTLYPAVGLYQRDDQVTILPVVSKSAGSSDSQSKQSIVPAIKQPLVLTPLLSYAVMLLDKCTKQLTTEEMHKTFTAVKENLNEAFLQFPSLDVREVAKQTTSPDTLQNPFLVQLLPPLLSSLTVMGRLTSISLTTSLHLLPLVTNLVRRLDSFNRKLAAFLTTSHSSRRMSFSDGNDKTALSPSRSGTAWKIKQLGSVLTPDVCGEWELRSVAAGTIPAQQYLLLLEEDTRGQIQGKSSGSVSAVTLSGAVRGTRIRFLESWRQGGSCFVEGRIRSDGLSFQGTYEDAKSRTTGSISGNRTRNDRHSMRRDCVAAMAQRMVQLECLASIFIGKLCYGLILGEHESVLDPEGIFDDSFASSQQEENDEEKSHSLESELGGTKEAGANVYTEWLESQLLRGGLPTDQVCEHLERMVNLWSETGLDSNMLSAHANSVISAWFSSAFPALADRSSQGRAAAYEGGLGAKFAGAGVQDATDLDEIPTTAQFLDDLINGRGKAVNVDKWILRHVGESPFTRLGGEHMKTARRAVAAAILCHSASCSLALVQCASSAPAQQLSGSSVASSRDSGVRPDEKLILVWRATQRVIEWAVRAKNQTGSSYATMASLLLRKARFLLSLQPSAEVAAAASVSPPEIAQVAGSVAGIAPLPTFGLKGSNNQVAWAERIFSSTVQQVSRFMESPIRVIKLRAMMMENCTRAFLRCCGLNAIRIILGDHRYLGSVSAQIPQTGGILSPKEADNGIQLSCAIGGVLQWLAPGLRGNVVDLDLNNSGGLTGSSRQRLQGGSGKFEDGYFLSGLGGCGKKLSTDIKTSFEAVYSLLASTLSKGTWAGDIDLQLAVLQAWGIIIKPDDHAFLARVGIFRILQTVLDEARGGDNPGPSMVSRKFGDSDRSTSKDGLDDLGLVADNKKRLVQSALKVVHLLAAQVANVGEGSDDDSSSEPSVGTSSKDNAAGAGVGSMAVIPLSRKPSGPETLGKSVFDMLYTELKNALQDVRDELSVAKNACAASGIEPVEADNKEAVAEVDKDHSSDAGQYCYQIMSLLFSVSGAAVCRSHLSSPRWLRLLLGLLEGGTAQIQRRVLRLLRRLLPSIDPDTIRFRFDRKMSVEYESDDDIEIDTEEGVEANYALNLLFYLMDTIGYLLPPSVSLGLVSKVSASQVGKQPHGVDANTETPAFTTVSPLASEMVVLLRSLQTSTAWSKLLSEACEKSIVHFTFLKTSEKGSAPAANSTDTLTLSETLNTSSVRQYQEKNHQQLFAARRAISALCILGGHIEGLRVGGAVRLVPRTGTNLQEVALRGARGILVSLDPQKPTAEVVINSGNFVSDQKDGKGQSGSSTQSSTATKTTASAVVRPVRLPLDDLTPVPEINVDPLQLSTGVITAMLGDNLKKYLKQLEDALIEIETKTDLTGMGDASVLEDEDEEEDEEDASGAPGTGDESRKKHRQSSVDQAESEITADKVIEHAKKEAKVQNLVLSLHMFRAIAELMRNPAFASAFVSGGRSGDSLTSSGHPSSPLELMKELLRVAVLRSTAMSGVGEISDLEEGWLLLWSRWYELRRARLATPRPHAPSNESGKSATATTDGATSEPSALCQQMMEMGFPRDWCEVALETCGMDVERAINFCFEHSGDMERLVTAHKNAAKVAAEAKRSTSTRPAGTERRNPLLEQLSEMGFPVNWCKKALAANRNNVDAALTWILSNGDALEAEDRKDEDGKRTTAPGPESASAAVEGSINAILGFNPLMAVSGQASISDDLTVEGLTGGGFASVGARTAVLTSGKWYYEATLKTSGCIQIGWADTGFQGAADRGDGVGDGPHSWAYDGWRQMKWHGTSSIWGAKWSTGDVVGCGVDVDAGILLFTLNGKTKSVGMGVAFRGVQFSGGLYPCASFNRRESLRFNLGNSPFKHPPPAGFQPILNVFTDKEVNRNCVLRHLSIDGASDVVDCLEESIGEDNYVWESRYFGRDNHASLLRSSASASSNAIAVGSQYHHRLSAVSNTRSEASAELRTLPEAAVENELIMATTALAVLYARKTLVTLLASWPFEVLGPFSLDLLTPDPRTLHLESKISGPELFVQFIKLVATNGIQTNGSSKRGIAVIASDDDGKGDDAPGNSSYGRNAIQVLAPVIRSAIKEAAKGKRVESNEQHPLVQGLIDCIRSQVSAAAQRKYSHVPWDAGDPYVTANLMQLSADSGSTWTDKDVLSHPNVALAEWLTSLLMEIYRERDGSIPLSAQSTIPLHIFLSWTTALFSPSMCLKEKGFSILSAILHDVMPHGNITVPKEELETYIKALPVARVLALTRDRIDKERKGIPICSRYLQSLLEFASTLELASIIVGHSYDDSGARIRKMVEASEHAESYITELYTTDWASYKLQREKEKAAAAEEKSQEPQSDATALEQQQQQQQQPPAQRSSDLSRSSARSEGDILIESGDDSRDLPSAFEAAILFRQAVSASERAHAGDIIDFPSFAIVGEGGTIEIHPGNDEEGAVDDSRELEEEEDEEEEDEEEDYTDVGVQAMDIDVEDLRRHEASQAEERAAEQQEQREAKIFGMLASVGKRRIKAEAVKPSVDEDELVGDQAEDLNIDTSRLSPEDADKVKAGRLGIRNQGDPDWYFGPEASVLSDTEAKMWSGTLTQKKQLQEPPPLGPGSKVVRGPDWKWRDQDGGEGSIGVVESVSPWSGVEGEGMSVRWPNDAIYTYRWGADGFYDLTHVVVNDKNEILSKHPTPKPVSKEQGGFGQDLHLGIVVRIDYFLPASKDGEREFRGFVEWPDYGAVSSMVGRRLKDGDFWFQELQLVQGDGDMGWMARFGCENWQPGTIYEIKKIGNNQCAGSYRHNVLFKGRSTEVQGEIILSSDCLFTMDKHCHAPSIQVSDDGTTVTCKAGDSRAMALGTVGFSRGVHYWEVRVEQAEFGSVFIGVCEKAGPPGSQAALTNRLNRWYGWGFVNFRATYHNSTERIYGDHFNAGDTIGVRLDMERGKLAFFMDGIKYGEHIVSDLGVAFDNLHGDRGMYKTLYPAIGLRKAGDSVKLNGKFVSSPGVPSARIIKDMNEISWLLHTWTAGDGSNASSSLTDELASTVPRLPPTFVHEAWENFKRWKQNRWQRYAIRPRGLLVDFDTSPFSCEAIGKAAGLALPFLAGDRVKITTSGGRELDQAEEAVVLGAYSGHLWYRTETQGHEGAEEGRLWAWYWTPEELVQLLLLRRNGKDMTVVVPPEVNSDGDVPMSEADSKDLVVELTSEALATAEELSAIESFEAFEALAAGPHWTIEADSQLVQCVNALSAAKGVDAPNLRYTDVLSLEEEQRLSSSSTHGHGFGTRGYFSEASALRSMSGAYLRARCAIIRALNSKIARILPYIRIELPDSIVGGISLANGGALPAWKRISTGRRLRALRTLVFTSTKRTFWDWFLRATTTNTPLPSDEYEDPREIRVIRINRIQAQPSKLAALTQASDRLRRSVFGQLYREMRTWSDSSFRRAYCGKGHGGQKRAFKVKFLGEGVNDYGGPYRAVFEQVMDELQMDSVELSKGEQALLPLLVPCPNRRSGVGSNQDKFVLNPSCGTSSNGPVALELHRFLGKIIGTAVRHGLQMGLDLPSLVWRPLAGLPTSRRDIKAIDSVAVNVWDKLESQIRAKADVTPLVDHQMMVTHLSDGREVPLVANGEETPLAPENVQDFVRLSERKRLMESAPQLLALAEGLAAVLPLELFPLFTDQELEDLLCGRREVDVELLKQCTEYEEVDEGAPHVRFFWETLKEMTLEDRTEFLRFVWARSRMPTSAKDFPMNFKIQAAHEQGARDSPDKYLPHAQTCFFSLSLPAYTSKDILRDKLLFAIKNSPNMDADVRLHNAEGWADA